MSGREREMVDEMIREVREAEDDGNRAWLARIVDACDHVSVGVRACVLNEIMATVARMDRMGVGL